MTEQLYRATVNGVARAGFVINERMGDRFYFENSSGNCVSVLIPAPEVKDLRPVRVVDMDAVVIEGGEIAVRKELIINKLNNLRATRKVRLNSGKDTTVQDSKIDVLETLFPQLSTPAELATGGAMKSPTHETTEISSTSIGESKCNCGLEYSKHQGMVSTNCDFLTTPQSPKGVTIELTEVDTQVLLNTLEKDREYAIAGRIRSQLTPRMEEPKELTCEECGLEIVISILNGKQIHTCPAKVQGLGAVIRAKDKLDSTYQSGTFEPKLDWVFDGKFWCNYEKTRRWEQLQVLSVKRESLEDYPAHFINPTKEG